MPVLGGAGYQFLNSGSTKKPVKPVITGHNRSFSVPTGIVSLDDLPLLFESTHTGNLLSGLAGDSILLHVTIALFVAVSSLPLSEMAKKKSTAPKRNNAAIAKAPGTARQREWRGSDPSDQERLTTKKTKTKHKQTTTEKKTNGRKGIQPPVSEPDDESSSDEVDNAEEALEDADSNTEGVEACESGVESLVS